MNDPEITRYVVKALGKHNSINQITVDICEKTGMKWDEAQKFIETVQVEYEDEIIQRQRPLLVILATFSIITGLTLSIGMVVATMNGLIIFFLRMPIPYLGNIMIILAGLAMVGGGIMGALKKSK
ncbi:MAG: hypothetical protein H6657_14590 [Ardenticatenaceae bacterium]|nr:hypothetical protein [Ardenticatenaceae bacterium]